MLSSKEKCGVTASNGFFMLRRPAGGSGLRPPRPRCPSVGRGGLATFALRFAQGKRHEKAARYVQDPRVESRHR
jgi:hypothetical protein